MKLTIEPNRLRKLVEDAIKKHMPARKFKALMEQEEEEQQKIRDIMDQIKEDLDE